MAVLKYYDAGDAAWKYIAASTTANFTTWKKTMSGGETSVSGTDDNAVTLSYTVGLEQVFINGVLQVRGSDYTATNGTSVTGLSALVASDIVTVICYAPFNVANTIAPTVVDAKGDLIVGTAADTVGRLAVGSTNGQLLSVDSSTASGLAWVNPGMTLVKTQSFSAVSSTSVENVFSATYSAYKIIVSPITGSTGSELSFRLRVSGADNSSNVYVQQEFQATSSTISGARNTLTAWNGSIMGQSNTTANNATPIIEIFNPFETGYTVCNTVSNYDYAGSIRMWKGSGVHQSATSFTGFTLYPASGTITGSISVYGYNK